MSETITHHVKYEEIHGVDETVQIPLDVHQKLHRQLREEGNCNISPTELKKISTAASNRSPKTINQKKEYHRAKIRSWLFDDKMDNLVWHREIIRYNEQTGSVYVNGLFAASGGRQLRYISG